MKVSKCLCYPLKDMEMKPKEGDERRLVFFAIHRLPEHLADPGLG